MPQPKVMFTPPQINILQRSSQCRIASPSEEKWAKTRAEGSTETSGILILMMNQEKGERLTLDAHLRLEICERSSKILIFHLGMPSSVLGGGAQLDTTEENKKTGRKCQIGEKEILPDQP